MRCYVRIACSVRVLMRLVYAHRNLHNAIFSCRMAKSNLSRCICSPRPLRDTFIDHRCNDRLISICRWKILLDEYILDIFNVRRDIFAHLILHVQILQAQSGTFVTDSSGIYGRGESIGSFLLRSHLIFSLFPVPVLFDSRSIKVPSRCNFRARTRSFYRGRDISIEIPRVIRENHAILARSIFQCRMNLYVPCYRFDICDA